MLAHPREFLAGIGVLLALSASVGGYQWYARKAALDASADVSTVSVAYYEAMGVGPGQPFVEPANPETARSVREEYVGKLTAVAEEHGGTASAVQALLLAGQLHVELGDADAARATFERAVGEAPRGSALEAVALARLAESYEAAGLWSEAASAWERAAGSEDYPLRLHALAFAARALDAAGERERALALADRLDAEAGETTSRIPPHVQARLDELRAGR